MSIIEKIRAYVESRKNTAETLRERNICIDIIEVIDYIQEKSEKPINPKPVMIEWTGNNLKEVIEFTGKSPRFDEWFKTWDEYESYVHSHGNIFKLFNEDGTHLEVPVGAWIFKTPDGRNVPSTFLYQEQPVKPYSSETMNEKADFDGGFTAMMTEQPVCEGLEEEMDEYYTQLPTDAITHLSVNVYQLIARHFYELGRRGKPKVSEDLEKEIERYIRFNGNGYSVVLDDDDLRKLARHFAQWQKEQMLKEAVEIEVVETCGIPSVWVKTAQSKAGDKVRIVIVKEEGK